MDPLAPTPLFGKLAFEQVRAVQGDEPTYLGFDADGSLTILVRF
jgi:hypothetical protein